MALFQRATPEPMEFDRDEATNLTTSSRLLLELKRNSKFLVFVYYTVLSKVFKFCPLRSYLS